MKYILDYLNEERGLMPVAMANFEIEEEFANYETPIGVRVIINDKDTGVVVHYNEYSEWLETKYEQLTRVN